MSKLDVFLWVSLKCIVFHKKYMLKRWRIFEKIQLQNLYKNLYKNLYGSFITKDLLDYLKIYFIIYYLFIRYKSLMKLYKSFTKKVAFDFFNNTLIRCFVYFQNLIG